MPDSQELLDPYLDPETGILRNLAELCAIHRHLFQDLCDWAGRIRIIDIRKNVGSAEFFLPSGMIEQASVFAAWELRSDNALRGRIRRVSTSCCYLGSRRGGL